ncbi:hypothetical protein AMAG_04291 [Allomyces macrogynus ATCC 38327]|uniref:Uncharacterized protein n=1 Tax=Allomyces macrogynus (strain ATCC 38327) TaxID=578462 RepID=A0A0L0S8C0_ALLM3|nr:hypothetical protein AMAG_04291 [Allomyces macrogynus ATCC 38327]|eukprot:KNE58737.1 hypothetical protein AMAG_04291 [Allomyces macrogynus ATCC 38327]
MSQPTWGGDAAATGQQQQQQQPQSAPGSVFYAPPQGVPSQPVPVQGGYYMPPQAGQPAFAMQPGQQPSPGAQYPPGMIPVYAVQPGMFPGYGAPMQQQQPQPRPSADPDVVVIPFSKRPTNPGSENEYLYEQVYEDAPRPAPMPQAMMQGYPTQVQGMYSAPMQPVALQQPVVGMQPIQTQLLTQPQTQPAQGSAPVVLQPPHPIVTQPSLPTPTILTTPTSMTTPTSPKDEAPLSPAKSDVGSDDGNTASDVSMVSPAPPPKADPSGKAPVPATTNGPLPPTPPTAAAATSRPARYLAGPTVTQLAPTPGFNPETLAASAREHDPWAKEPTIAWFRDFRMLAALGALVCSILVGVMTTMALSGFADPLLIASVSTFNLTYISTTAVLPLQYFGYVSALVALGVTYAYLQRAKITRT